MNPSTSQLRSIACQFDLHGEFLSAVPYGSGHINDTFRVDVDQGGRRVRYILQRVNDNVFKDPAAVMRNVEHVTQHLKTALENSGIEEATRRCLTLVPTNDGAFSLIGPQGGTWRVFLFIERTYAVDVIENTHQAREAAAAFGTFQTLLADLPAQELNETIPGFHHTRRRFNAFQKALELDPNNRAANAKEAIAFVHANESDVDTLVDLHEAGEIPLRTTHNDTKINNVLFDEDCDEGICVVDLDTVMPGLAHYDFGDMIRGSTATALEDERDLSKMEMDFDLFKAVTSGYLSTATFLTPLELEHLPFSGKLITLECGMRFLTDYLLGDTYFKTSRLDQNLDRARSQFKLVQSITRQEEAMSAYLATLQPSS